MNKLITIMILTITGAVGFGLSIQFYGEGDNFFGTLELMSYFISMYLIYAIAKKGAK